MSQNNNQLSFIAQNYEKKCNMQRILVFLTDISYFINIFAAEQYHVT
jgi:hypothetical protein